MSTRWWSVILSSALLGCAASPPAPASAPPDGTGGEASRAEALELRLGSSFTESNSSVDETRVFPVFVAWRDAQGAHHQHVLNLSSGAGEGAGDFATLEDLDWPEAEELLRANRPPGTLDTLYFSQGRLGWVGLHLVRAGATHRLVIQRYGDVGLLASGEGTVTLEPSSEGYDPEGRYHAPTGQEPPLLELPPLPELQ